uniref:Uncharacterized protein n=1 Tax=Leersia perrieri TaxID=77586 RepID=A0A0D9VL56_9ORYZ
MAMQAEGARIGGDLMVEASDSKMTKGAVDELYKIWIKAYGVPSFARCEEVIIALVDLVGEVRVGR